MKKILTILIIFTLILPIKINAEEEQQEPTEENEISSDIVTFSNCVDVESARFILGVTEIKVKFLGIQKINYNEIEELTEEIINNYVCESLKNASEIKLEYESNIEKEDGFGRVQAWVKLDDKLLQEDLLTKGYAKILHLEEDYIYANELKEAQNSAKENKAGIWNKEENEEPEKEEEEEEEKSKNIFTIIFDFFADIFRKIRDFVDGIIKSISK